MLNLVTIKKMNRMKKIHKIQLPQIGAKLAEILLVRAVQEKNLKTVTVEISLLYKLSN